MQIRYRNIYQTINTDITVSNLRLAREFLSKVTMPWSYGFPWYYLEWTDIEPIRILFTIHDLMDNGGWQLLAMPERDISPFNRYWVLLPVLRDIREWLRILPPRSHIAVAPLNYFPNSYLYLYCRLSEWLMYFLQCRYDTPVGRRITIEFLSNRCRIMLEWTVAYLPHVPSLQRHYLLFLLTVLGDMLLSADATAVSGRASGWLFRFD